jgi:hypothetical protein
MSQEKRNIQPLIEKEEPHLHNILPSEDVKAFKNMVGELRDTWTKKQIFRTETEARISVLQDMKYPTKAAKVLAMRKRTKRILRKLNVIII